jgi:hypothetical protein
MRGALSLDPHHILRFVAEGATGGCDGGGCGARAAIAHAFGGGCGVGRGLGLAGLAGGCGEGSEADGFPGTPSLSTTREGLTQSRLPTMSRAESMKRTLSRAESTSLEIGMSVARTMLSTCSGSYTTYSWPLETARAMQTESKPLDWSFRSVMSGSPVASRVRTLPRETVASRITPFLCALWPVSSGVVAK